jgi:ABC-type transport system involved in multi-copper enzyme maturation permease subunit
MNGCLVIIERELLGLLRSPKALLILVAVALLFAMIVILKWPTSGVVQIDASQLTAAAEAETQPLSGVQARIVFQWLAYAMLTAAILIVPVFPAMSLVTEVRRRTLELLLNSPLSRTSIYLGKVGAMLGFVILLMCATLPAMGCCFLMGGVSLTADSLKLYAFLLLVCLQLIVIGMLVGTWCRSAESALRWSYGVTFGLLIAPVFPELLFPGGTSPLAQGAAVLKRFSPVPSLMQMLNLSGLGGAGMLDERNLLMWYIPFAVLFIVIGSVVCISRLKHAMLDRARSQGAITDEQDGWIRASRRLLYVVDPQRRTGGIPAFLNPVMVKEFQCRKFGRMHWLLRLVAVCAVLSLLLTLAASRSTETRGVSHTGALIIVLQVALIVVLTPGLAAGMIASEREGGSWNLLRVTPLRPGKILRGKLLSVVLTLALLLCATLPGYAVMMLIQPNLQQQVVQVLICLVLAAVLSMLISAAVSSCFRNTAVATTVAYGLLITLFAGTMLVWVNRDAPFGYSVVENALRLNPMAAALNAIQASGFQSYQLIPSAWWIGGVTSGLLLIVLYARIARLSQPD